jgi:hypothetical protein
MWTMTTSARVNGRTAGQRKRNGLQELAGRSWAINAPLTATVLFMLAVLGTSIVGLIVDPRIVTGAPVWLKPAKFAVSIIIYALTVVWTFNYLDGWWRTRTAVGWLNAVTLTTEIVIILVQVQRGTSSHFNISTPLNAALWATMGAAIVVQTLTSIALAVAVWRERFADRAVGWALRLGLTLSILGASSAFLMTQPTRAQLDDMRAGQRPLAVGAHTVGAPDGGPGIAGTGWSTQHGDLRVPHFIGLHAFQALPLVAIATKRRGWPDQRRVRLVLAAAVSYATFFALLLLEALRGYSLVRPDGFTLTALAVWAGLSIGAAIAARNSSSNSASAGR